MQHDKWGLVRIRRINNSKIIETESRKRTYSDSTG
jgi:hypothetical protein